MPQELVRLCQLKANRALGEQVKAEPIHICAAMPLLATDKSPDGLALIKARH